MGYALTTFNATLRTRSCNSLIVNLALSWIWDNLLPAAGRFVLERERTFLSRQPINANYQSGEAKKKSTWEYFRCLNRTSKNFKGAKWIVFVWILFWFLLFCSSWRSVAALCRPSGRSSGPCRKSPALPAGWELRLGRWSKATYMFKVPKEFGKKVWVFCENKLGCNRIIGFVLQCFVLFVCFFPDHSGARIPVPLSEGSCGVRLGREKNHSVSFFSRYDSCYAHIEVQA